MHGRSARLIAHYLPQFHPIPENDEWWGKGFTEWTNVRKARPLFAGHEQPLEPGELGYYDLRDPETRAAQAELAANYGVEAFCYWHYWFAGRRLLERPFNEVLASKEPRFPICLGWANHTWTAQWVGRPWEVRLEQTYPWPDDIHAHFDAVRPAFEDDRYVTVDGKPLFFLFRPGRITKVREFTDGCRERAHKAGLKGIYFVGAASPDEDITPYGIDCGVDIGPLGALPHWLGYRDQVERRLRAPTLWKVHQALARFERPDSALRMPHDLLGRALKLPLVVDYHELTKNDYRTRVRDDRHPSVMPNWDNTPRVGRWGVVFDRATPERWGDNLRAAIRAVSHRPLEHRLIFLKSWNEWAEGNYLEPDRRPGRALHEATRAAVNGL